MFNEILSELEQSATHRSQELVNAVREDREDRKSPQRGAPSGMLYLPTVVSLLILFSGPVGNDVLTSGVGRGG